MNFRYRWNRVATSLISIGLCLGCSNLLQLSNSKGSNPVSPEDCLVKNQPKRTANPFTINVNLTQEGLKQSSTITQSQSVEYVFESESDQILHIEPNDTASVNQKICVNVFSSSSDLIQSSFLKKSQVQLPSKGTYAIDLFILEGAQSYDITLRLDRSITNPSSLRPSTKLPATPVDSSLSINPHVDINPSSPSIKRSYNPSRSPRWGNSNRLQSIIENILRYRTQKGNALPRNNISIALIDIKNEKAAYHQENVPRFPASVVKMFWMVIFYDRLNYLDVTQFQYHSILEDIEKMMIKSDNTAASNIVDLISNAPSGVQEKEYPYKMWHQNRLQMNEFFRYAGYTNMDISQKTFPFKFPEPGEYGEFPKGYEEKMRGDPNVPIRNKISTEQAARLMYEIVFNKARIASNSEMLRLLERDLMYDWKQINPLMEFNPVLRFFGEYLPRDTILYSKAGWTSKTRQEVAYIKSGNTEYILAIFLDESPAYAKNLTLFPELSCIVFEQMTQRTCDHNK